MRNSIVERGIETLKWLRNEGDGGWGEFRNQPSRLVNTAEAVWAICSVDPKDKSWLEKALEFLCKSVDGRHEEIGKNCEHARDHAWILFALTSCGYKLDDRHVPKCVEWLINNENKAELGGWCPNEPTKKDATQPTALAIVSLLKVRNLNKDDTNSDGMQDLVGRIERRIEQGVYALERLRNREDSGWGKMRNWQSTPAYTAYALFALANCDDMVHERECLTEGLDYLISQMRDGRWKITEEPPDRPEKLPYRHFTNAWALLALTSKDEWRHREENYRAATWLIQTQNSHDFDNGWSGINGGTGSTTWGTADAVNVLWSFSKRADFAEIFRMIELFQRRIQNFSGELKKRENLTSLRYIWSIRGNVVLGTNDFVFNCLFVVYSVIFGLLYFSPPLGVSPLLPVFIYPIGIGFFAYSFWNKKQKQSPESSITFAIAVVGALYTILLGVYPMLAKLW